METEKGIEAVRRAVLPVIALDPDGAVHCIGTSFVIAAAGRDALLITAAHVTAVFNRLENPHERHHPSSLFFVKRVLTPLDKTRPQAIWYDEKFGGYAALIGQTVSMEQADISAAIARFGDQVPTEVAFDRTLALDTSPVCVGEEVMAIGYPKMEFSGAVTGDNQLSGHLHFPKARVVEVFPNGGPTGQATPCFSIDAGLPHGMSGGPVISQDASGRCFVRGIVRSDISDHESDTSKGNALVTAIWPALLLPFSPPGHDGAIDWSRTLLDMQKKGAIFDKGNASERVQVERDADGHILNAIYASI